jgi:hypothetical protein
MIFKILDRAFGLGVMARPGGELAIPKRAQVAADRLRADRAAEFFPDPLGQIHWARSASRQGLPLGGRSIAATDPAPCGRSGRRGRPR